MRLDVVIDMQGDPGRRYAVVDEFYDDLAYTLTHLAYDQGEPVRAHPLDAPLALPRNPLPEPDLANAERHDIVLQGGMMGGGMMMGMGGMNGMATPGMDGGAAWAINGMSMTGDGQADMPPMLTFERGRSVLLNIQEPDGVVAPDALARPQLPRAHPQRRPRSLSPMGRHGPSGAQRCRAMRLRRRQSRRLDAALPRHESSDDRSDDHPARRMSDNNQTKGKPK